MDYKEMIEGFWEHLHNAFEIETREELEEHAKGWEPQNPLVVALHYIWKRDPNVESLQKQLADSQKEVTALRESLNDVMANKTEAYYQASLLLKKGEK